MTHPMTHRERVLAALSHREPDRIPIDLGSTRDSSIVVDGYERLKRHFGIEAPSRLSSRMMQVVEVDERILAALDIDTRAVLPPAPLRGADEEVGHDRYRDEWGVVRVKPAGALYYDQVAAPLAGEITVRQILDYPWPDPADPGRLRGLAARIREIREGAGCAAVLNLPSAFVHVSQYLRGFEDWFMDMAADQRLMEVLFDAVLEITLGISETLLREVGQEVDVLMASDDLGLQDRLMVSVETYRKLIKPRQARFFRRLHELSPAKVFFHTCGSVAPIVEDLIEIGVDVLNPVQVSAAGMEPEGLKRRYGGRLAFWGAVDTQRILPYGTVGEVEREVERLIDILGPGGGYVLSAVHNLQPDVPVENLLAMFARAREYRPSFSRESGESEGR
jgi:uroporphyrinogen decarboxylase